MTPQTTIAFLRRAADRLERPGAWTQGVLARDKNGRGIAGFPSDPEAVSWCSIGALHAESFVDYGEYSDEASLLTQAAEAAITKFLNTDVASWNDAMTNSQAHVVATFRAAADALEAELPLSPPVPAAVKTRELELA